MAKHCSHCKKNILWYSYTEDIGKNKVICADCSKQRDKKKQIKQTKSTKKTKRKSKSKSMAILLAVFFGIFAWWYTYKKDKIKFWTGFIIIILLCFLMPQNDNIIMTMGLFVWFWAIIDVSIKSEEWYDTMV